MASSTSTPQLSEPTDGSATDPAPTGQGPSAAARRKLGDLTGWRRRVAVSFVQAVVLATFLGLWEFLPRIGSLSDTSNLLDPFFISSPSQVYEKLVDLFTGRNNTAVIWPYVWPTFSAAVAGAAIGLVTGGFVGLLLSSFRFLSDVVRPFVVALNAIPRIALIPIVVILFGTTFQSSVIIAVMIVFFVGLFNAYEGGRAIEPHVIQNARILGASKWDIMRTIRYPYALAWTLAGLPVAVSFAIISVVTGEILTGYRGLGRLIRDAQAFADASLTFSVVIVLSVLALVLLAVAEAFKRRVLHWWVHSDE